MRNPAAAAATTVVFCLALSSNAFRPASLRRSALLRSVRLSVNFPTSAGSRTIDAGKNKPLSMEEGNGELSSATKKDLVQSRKRRIKAEYATASVLLLINAAFLLTNESSYGIGHRAYAVSGPVMASAVSRVCRGAAEHDRLGSDTYKRLNLSLFIYAALGVLSCGMISARLFAIPLLISMKPSIKGWYYGVRGIDKGGEAKLVGELVEGAKGTLKGLVSLEKTKAAGYLAATFFAEGMMIRQLFIVAGAISSGAGLFAIGGRIFPLSKLALLIGISYTLKDAADRERLDGTTFVWLNFVSSLVFGAMAADLVEQVAGMTSAVAAAGAFSLFSALNGLASTAKKRQAAA